MYMYIHWRYERDDENSEYRLWKYIKLPHDENSETEKSLYNKIYSNEFKPTSSLYSKFLKWVELYNLFEGEENKGITYCKHMGNNQIVQRFYPTKIKIINLYFHVNIAMC